MTASDSASKAPLRFRRLSRVLAASCLALIIVLPIGVLTFWLLTDASQVVQQANLPADAVQAPLELWQRMAGALITEASLALLLLGLWEARKCFNLFATGQVFTTRAVRCLRRFAGWTMASVVAGIAAGSAISVVLTMNNPPGMRHLSVSFGSDQVFTLFFAGMVWLMAAVIGQGQTLAEENATFI